jgi:hypothetical protein
LNGGKTVIAEAMHAKRSRTLWGCLARCFGANKDQAVKEEEKKPVLQNSLSKERETRIRMWVNESHKKLHELVELPETITKDDVTKVDEEQPNVVDQPIMQQGGFPSKRKSAADRKHKCKPNRNNALLCENIDPQLTPCHSNPCKMALNPQHVPPLCMNDTFRSMVPDALHDSPPPMQQKISFPAWFTTACTSSRK